MPTAGSCIRTARLIPAPEILRLFFNRLKRLEVESSRGGNRIRAGRLVMFQAVKRIDALPLTRDHMLESERTKRFAGLEQVPRTSGAA